MATIAQLEATVQKPQQGGENAGSDEDSDVHRLIAECYKLLGNTDAFSSHIGAARLAPTSSGPMHDVLSSVLGYHGTAKLSREGALQVQRDVLQLVDEMIQPALAASSAAGVST